MEMYMKVNLCKGNVKVKVLISSQMEKNILDNGFRINNMVEEYLHLRMEMFMMVFGIKTISKVMV